MNSLAIVTRAYDAEAPYIVSFIEYYKKIGVNEFHIVVPQGNRYEVLRDECSDLEGVTLYFDYECSEELKHFNAAQNIALPKVKASHILSIDIDEYLYIKDVHPLLEYDYLQFHWIIAPFSFFGGQSVLGFQDAQCKYLVRTDLCKRLAIHDCELYRPTSPVKSDVKLIHYVYRSFNDLYLKCALSNYQSYQKTNENQLVEGMKDSVKLPLKFKMAAIYQRICHASHKHEVPNYCKIDFNIETLLIRSSMYYENITELKSAFLNYYSRIDLEKFITVMKSRDSYKQMGRIPHYELAEISDCCLLPSIIPENWLVPQKNSKQNLSKLIGKVIKLLKLQ